jgi:hypothetical protein
VSEIVEGPGFGTFWHGALNPFAYACLTSFASHRAPLVVYSYEAGLELPTGITRLDARQICADPETVKRYRVDGNTSIATFADMFRYRMIRDTGRCWVDSDIFCLTTPDFRDEDYIFARQADAVSEELVNNAVLRLPKDHPALAEMISTADASTDRDLKWGALGPFLLTPTLQRLGGYERARIPREFYPVEPEQFWKVFLPAWRAQMEDKVRGATFLHLWSEAITWTGWDRRVGPPVGSFLHEAFASVRVINRFDRLAEAGEAEAAFARFS